MKRKMKVMSLFLLLFFSLGFISAEISIDVSIAQKDPVSVGDKLQFEVRLIDGTTPISDNVDVYFSDALGNKNLKSTVKSNENNFFLIATDFPSGLWNVKAVYKDKQVERSFSVAEKSSVEFLIEGTNLIIRNTGNVRYTKPIELTIGSEKQTKTLNLKVGEEKQWKLVAPDGNYNIVVTDGEKTLRKENVQLLGTGNVIGAIDEGVMGTGLLGGPIDPNQVDSSFLSKGKIPVALAFVGAILGIGVLLLVESRLKSPRR